MSGQSHTNSEVLDAAVVEPTLGGALLAKREGDRSCEDREGSGDEGSGVDESVDEERATKIDVTVCHISRLSW